MNNVALYVFCDVSVLVLNKHCIVGHVGQHVNFGTCKFGTYFFGTVNCSRSDIIFSRGGFQNMDSTKVGSWKFNETWI